VERLLDRLARLAVDNLDSLEEGGGVSGQNSLPHGVLNLGVIKDR
jgi:hypothetical protein